MKKEAERDYQRELADEVIRCYQQRELIRKFYEAERAREDRYHSKVKEQIRVKYFGD